MYFNDNVKTSPYSITKFKSELKKYSWTLKKDKKVSLESTQVAGLMKKMIQDNYDLDQISFTKEVPGFFVEKLPKDISFIKDETLSPVAE